MKNLIKQVPIVEGLLEKILTLIVQAKDTIDSKKNKVWKEIGQSCIVSLCYMRLSAKSKEENIKTYK